MGNQYTYHYNIKTPHLKREGNIPAAYNPQLGDFTFRYDRSVLEAFGLNAVSFSFFILWNKDKTDGDFNRTIWIKREISIQEDLPVNLADPVFDKKFFANEDRDQFDRNLLFFRQHDMTCRYMVIKDLHEDFDLSGHTMVAIETEAEGQGHLRKRPITLDQMNRMLIENSNGKFRIGKELKFYETDLERYLSLHSAATGALFPGDCDMLLYDGSSQCRYILEFKKCTSRGNIPVEEQSFLNYISLDRSKYIRLNILRKYMEEKEGRRIPLINVFYPTTREQIIKLEEIGRDMRPGKACTLEMKANPRENQYGLCELVKENY